jgi:hypothetical protein
MLVILALLVILAVLTPILGADSRDGRDWAPGHRRPTRSENAFAPRVALAARLLTGRRHAVNARTTGSPARTSAAPSAADGCRTAPAAG